VYLAGPQIARGYRTNSELTADRFHPLPFRHLDDASFESAEEECAGCAYRTGDVAKRLGDGRICILGRIDLEVKVHGYRVNLPDLEVALERIKGVEQAVATLTREKAPHLVAFVRMNRGWRGNAEVRLRQNLSERLPAYAVPSRIRRVDAFPMLRNGKVNRAALASLAETPSPAGPDGAFVAPTTPTERILAETWTELLAVPRVSVTDDFFSLGGDSLDAQRFILLAEEKGLEVTVSELQSAESLAALALAIETKGLSTREGVVR
jgi:hypothetical protein